MRPIRLELHNVLQHAKTCMDYMYGSTGITAPNGTGKSNLVDAGQYFAITGKVAGDKTKAELLHWNAQEGHSLFVFEHDGKEYTLKRNVHNASVSLKEKGDKKGLTGAEANSFMEGAIGMAFDRFYEICWAPQGQLTDILRMSHANRVAFFQRLVDVRKAEVLRGIIQENGLAKIPEYPDRSSVIEETQTELKHMLLDLEDKEQKYAHLLDMDKTYQPLIERARATLSLPTEADRQAKVWAAETVLKQKEQALTDWLVRNNICAVPEVSAPTTQQKELYTGLCSYEALSNAYAEQKAKFDALSGSAAALVVVPEPDSALFDRLSALVAEKMPEYKMASMSVCPTCKRPMEGSLSEEQIAKISAEYADLSRQLEAAKSALNSSRLAYSQYEKRAASNADLLDQQVARLDEIVTEMDKIPGAALDFDKATYLAYVKDYEAYCSYLYAKSRVDKQTEDMQKAIDAAASSVHSAISLVVASSVEASSARLFKEQYDAMQQDIRSVGMARAAVEARITEVTKTLNVYTSEQQQRAKSLALRRMLERCREVLHRDCLPKVVMQGALYGINALMGNYLALFDTNFTCKVNANLDFVCSFDEKDDVRSGALSWGQAMALAIAFKFSISDLLAAKIPLLVLDEPTAFLDDTNIKCVGEVLKKARILTERGVFLQVATHEPELLSSFTRILDVSEMK